MAIVSSHILDATDGTHAGGIQARLVSLTSARQLFASESDPGGRILENVDVSEEAPDARYELTFSTRPYWDRKPVPSPHALDEIVLRFTMPDPEARYHLPLILSSHGYSAWVSAPEQLV